MAPNETFSSPSITSQSNPTSQVRVVARSRPFLPREINSESEALVSCASVLHQSDEIGEEVVVQIRDRYSSRIETYNLDAFYGDEDDNISQIFGKEVYPLIPLVFSGYNATVFAYGATGSGKTYTMQGTADIPGIMPLAMDVVLSICQSTGSMVEVSYYEVYMERCFDLLDIKQKEITVLEDGTGKVHLRGISSIEVKSMEEFHEILNCGIQQRKVGHTSLNYVSSRSHGVLVINIYTKNEDDSSYTCVSSGKLTLIDLAGNEDNRKTYSEGIRLQESAKINQSLFALSNVIHALNNRKLRIPYRDSKLTRILQDSLGGPNCALMIACLNPGEYHESLNTISLAARSRQMSSFTTTPSQKGTPQTRIDMEEKLRLWLESKGKTKNVHRIGGVGSPNTPTRTPIPVTPARRIGIFQSGSKGRITTRQPGAPTPLMNMAMEKLKNESQISPCTKRTGSKNKESASSLSCKDRCVSFNISSPSPRKPLSPLESNICVKSEDAGPFEPKTPLSENCMYGVTGTPLNHFYSISSSLKSSLIEKYVDFLNNASKEELVKVKGIGGRTAQYIIELREKTPLNSLKDLENTGLSSKQVHNLFSKAARDIF